MDLVWWLLLTVDAKTNFTMIHFGLAAERDQRMTSRYIHHIDATLLAAADRVSAAIAHALDGEDPATVTEIGGRRKAPIHARAHQGGSA